MRVWVVNYHDRTIDYVTGVADSKELAQVLAQRHIDAIESMPCEIHWSGNGQVGTVRYIGYDYGHPASSYGLEEFEVSTE